MFIPRGIQITWDGSVEYIELDVRNLKPIPSISGTLESSKESGKISWVTYNTKSSGVFLKDGTLVLSVIYEEYRNEHLNPEYVCFGRSEITIRKGATKGTCFWYDANDSSANGESKWSLFDGSQKSEEGLSEKYLPKLGGVYTRDQISEFVGGGDKQSYLPHSNGFVLCGCFDPKLNIRAPIEIDVGNAPNVIKYAELVVAQGLPIPVFLKRRTDQWEYAGRFKAVLFSRTEANLFPATKRRSDAIGVIYFEQEDFLSSDNIASDQGISIESALEGGKKLVQHLRRERSRSLVEAKKRVTRQQFGHLFCVTCGLSEQDLPSEIGEGCFEVHHNVPLAKSNTVVATKLDDLSVVCANCHRMLHRTRPLSSVTKFRNQMKPKVEA
jgi:hypothetical protein